MSSNTDDSKRLLRRAIATLPQDHALREVQFHLRQALSKMEAVEAKRNNREIQNTQAQEWQNTIKDNVVNPYNPVKTLSVIEQMIAKEQAKLNEIQAKKALKQKPDPEIDDDGLQTFFG